MPGSPLNNQPHELKPSEKGWYDMEVWQVILVIWAAVAVTLVANHFNRGGK
jgi:hypothetical protein